MNELLAKAQMLIRCAPAAAFDAFVRPDRINQFWLRGASGPLAPDARVDWEFMVPGATEQVTVTAFDQPRHIGFIWSGSRLEVNIRLVAMRPDITTVSVEVRGFKDDEIDQVIDATEGFAIVLCDLKVLLESGNSPHLVKDKAELINCSGE